jgi:hypothetical protein
MRVRKRLRRIKRLAYLGTVVGGVVAARRAKAARDARTRLGQPATWPPLQVGEPPVAAVHDLMTAAGAAPADVAGRAPGTGPLTSDEPVAAVGDLAADDRRREGRERAAHRVGPRARWQRPGRRLPCGGRLGIRGGQPS